MTADVWAGVTQPAVDEWAANSFRRRRFVALVLRVKGSTCHLCGEPNATSADHLVPRSKGGPVWDLANAAPAHVACNSARGNRSLADWFGSHPLPTRPRLAPSRDW